MYSLEENRLVPGLGLAVAAELAAESVAAAELAEDE
jgi:hypothetical protein